MTILQKYVKIKNAKFWTSELLLASKKDVWACSFSQLQKHGDFTCVVLASFCSISG